jgi:hypothetical protein
MSEEPRKRSRFDQTEPKRPSRFDRRSRSPPDRKASDRSRSPLPSRSPPAASNHKSDAAAAAAAAAARINAQLQARKLDTPPAQPVCIHASTDDLTVSNMYIQTPPPLRKSSDAATVTNEIYTQDGDYIKDIEINDLRNRYTLTKGGTQKLVITHFVQIH